MGSAEGTKTNQRGLSKKATKVSLTPSMLKNSGGQY